MKTIFFILSFFISIACFGINRIATVADAAIYGDYIQPGDLIIDTPTKPGEVIYYFMAKQWLRLREGGTIWLDGEKLGFIQTIKFCNTSDALKPWHIQSASVRNIPHTKVKAATFACQGLKNFELNGESERYTGLASWPETRKFLTGSFGFHFINKMFGGHGISVTVLDGGTIKLNGFEIQHGFSGVRINGGNYDVTVESIDISNFYIHDTGDGEGLYLGATHESPLAKLKNLKIYNGIITRTAAEALQVQHLVGGADIHHLTIRAADVRWSNAFMPGQDTEIQWSVDAGTNKLHHIIVDGFASVGLVPFSSNEKPEGGVSEISNILFNDGIDTGIYLHKSGSYGVHWIFDNIYFRKFNNCYYHCTGREERKFIVSAKNGTDKYTFKRIIYDGSKPSVFQKTAGLITGEVIQKELPSLEYINSGFQKEETASKIRQWHPQYAKYFPASKSGTVANPTLWQVGEIAIETNGEYSFYKCITEHRATTVSPRNNPNFTKLTWDENGIRNDQPGWRADSVQSNFPPDDLRLKEDNYWKKLGFGMQLPVKDIARQDDKSLERSN